MPQQVERAFTYRRSTAANTAGPVDIVWSRPSPEGVEPTTATVSQDRAGRWSVSMP
jgi:putative transposase